MKLLLIHVPIAFSLLISPLYSSQASVGPSCADSLLTTTIIANKIASIHLLKGTFEDIHPIDPSSIAHQYPNQYARIMRLFRDRPTHLTGINKGLPPTPVMELGQVFRNMHAYAYEIGEDLKYIVDSYPQNYYARPILYDYVARFMGPPTRLSDRKDLFDPTNQEQLNEISRYGKSIVCSLWAELRLSMRIGHLSRVNVTVKDLIAEGVIRDDKSVLSAYRDQEIDHFWFPMNATDLKPYAVALGETKVFDVPVTGRYPGRQRVLEQFKRYLEIASIVGAQLGLPAEIHYFFVAGISKGQIARLQKLTDEFNDNLKNEDPSVKSRVVLKVYGNYETPTLTSPRQN